MELRVAPQTRVSMARTGVHLLVAVLASVLALCSGDEVRKMTEALRQHTEVASLHVADGLQFDRDSARYASFLRLTPAARLLPHNPSPGFENRDRRRS